MCEICKEPSHEEAGEQDPFRLMECTNCGQVVHPGCLTVQGDGVVKKDLPSCWECPKCVLGITDPEKRRSTSLLDVRINRINLRSRLRRSRDGDTSLPTSESDSEKSTEATDTASEGGVEERSVKSSLWLNLQSGSARTVPYMDSSWMVPIQDPAEVEVEIEYEHRRKTSTASRKLTSKTRSTLKQRQVDQGRGLLDARMQPVVKLYRIDHMMRTVGGRFLIGESGDLLIYPPQRIPRKQKRCQVLYDRTADNRDQPDLRRGDVVRAVSKARNPGNPRTCPLCLNTLNYLSQHLKMKHRVFNLDERVLLLRLASGSLGMHGEPCAVPGCGAVIDRNHRLDHHVREHAELSHGQRETLRETLSRRAIARKLRLLRKSKPAVPLVSTFDLDEAKRQRAVRAAERNKSARAAKGNEIARTFEGAPGQGASVPRLRMVPVETGQVTFVLRLKVVAIDPEEGSFVAPFGAVKVDRDGRAFDPLQTLTVQPEELAFAAPFGAVKEEPEDGAFGLPFGAADEGPEDGAFGSPLTTATEESEGGAFGSPFGAVKEEPEDGAFAPFNIVTVEPEADAVSPLNIVTIEPEEDAKTSLNIVTIEPEDAITPLNIVTIDPEEDAITPLNIVTIEPEEDAITPLKILTIEPEENVNTSLNIVTIDPFTHLNIVTIEPEEGAFGAPFRMAEEEQGDGAFDPAPRHSAAIWTAPGS